MSESNSHLYIVATPIGNLEDMTFRAIRILQEVDYIFCEDTRQTQKLLQHYKIKNRTESFHAQSGHGRIDHMINILEGGQSIAYVTDCGTPGISDPSSLLVHEVRTRLPQVTISPIPGPSALTALVSVAGVPIDEFIFLGFLPHKKGRETMIKDMVISGRATICYESTHRIQKALTSIAAHMIELSGAERKIVIGRELTKAFEEIIEGLPSELLKRMQDDPHKEKGEFAIIVPGVK